MATLADMLALGAGSDGPVRTETFVNLREILGLVGGEGSESVGLAKGTWNDNSATFLMDPVLNTFIYQLNKRRNLKALNANVHGTMLSFSDPFDIPVTLFDGHGFFASLFTDRFDSGKLPGKIHYRDYQHFSIRGRSLFNPHGDMLTNPRFMDIIWNQLYGGKVFQPCQ